MCLITQTGWDVILVANHLIYRKIIGSLKCKVSDINDNYMYK